MTSKALREIYKPILFEHVSAGTPKQFCALALALVRDPSIAAQVTKADMNVEEDFQVSSAVLDTEVRGAAKKMGIWGKVWDEMPAAKQPHAMCGLLLALLPNITKLQITTRKMICEDEAPGWPTEPEQIVMMPKSQKAIWRYHEMSSWHGECHQDVADTMISTVDLFGFLANSCPKRLPKLQNLQEWKSNGWMPLFSFGIPSLKTIDFSLGIFISPYESSLHEFLPDDSPIFESVENITIRCDLSLFGRMSDSGPESHIREMLQRFNNVKSLTVAMRPIDYSFNLRDNDNLDFNMLFDKLVGSATSLTVQLDTIYPEDLSNAKKATALPDLHLTNKLELPELALLGEKGALTSVLDSPSGASVFMMHTFIITNATEQIETILMTLLEHRRSRFYLLKELHISYIMGSGLLESSYNETDGAHGANGEEESDGKEEVDFDGQTDGEDEDGDGGSRVHINLYKLLEDEGITVVRRYDSYPRLYD